MLRELNHDMKFWDVLVDPARKIRMGNKLYFGEDDSLVAEVMRQYHLTRPHLRFLFDGNLRSLRLPCTKLGETPLPKEIFRRPV